MDYGVRVMTALAARGGAEPISREHLARDQDVSAGFLDEILRALRVAGLTRSHRGTTGGWTLAHPPEAITVADVIRALEGPLASVRGVRPQELASMGIGEPFISLWVAVRAALRSVLEVVTLADLAAGTLPASVRRLLDDPEAWTVH